MWIKHASFWLIAAFVVFLIVPIFSSPEAQWENARTELRMIASAFGNADAKVIADDAKVGYTKVFVDTGLINLTRQAYVTERDRRESTMPMGGGVGATVDRTNNYLDVLAAMVYVLLLRLRMLLAWLPFVFPFLIGVVTEGFARRKIKFAEFGEYGATVFAGALHIGVILLMLPVFYALAPIPITPFFVPGWILVASLPIAIAISNANQLLPK